MPIRRWKKIFLSLQFLQMQPYVTCVRILWHTWRGQQAKLDTTLKTAVPTRWNSVLIMLQSVLNNAADLKKLADEFSKNCSVHCWTSTCHCWTSTWSSWSRLWTFYNNLIWPHRCCQLMVHHHSIWCTQPRCSWSKRCKWNPVMVQSSLSCITSITSATASPVDTAGPALKEKVRGAECPRKATCHSSTQGSYRHSSMMQMQPAQKPNQQQRKESWSSQHTEQYVWDILVYIYF